MALLRRRNSRLNHAVVNTRTVSTCSIDGCALRVHGQGLCNTHYRRVARGNSPEGPLKTVIPPEIRWRRLAVITSDDECWEWRGTHTPDGYGLFFHGISRAENRARMVTAHRWGYEHFVGPIPEGMECDHQCNNRGCVNWHHIVPATHRDNSLRSTSPMALNAKKTHCPQGHPYDEENTYLYRGNARFCRTCVNARKKGG